MRVGKAVALVLVVGLVILAIAGCGGGGGSAGKTIKIGAFYPLTGPNAIKGQFNRNGTELAVRDINAAGGVLGKRIEVLYEDTQGRKENVVNVVRKLVEQDKVVALLGEVASSVSIAAGPVVKQYKIPCIAPTSTNLRVVLDPEDPKSALVTVRWDPSAKLNPYYFRACFVDPVQGAALAQFAYDKLGKRTAAIYYNIAQDYNKGLAMVFKDQWLKLGGQIVAEETYPDGTQDFKPQLTNIKTASPEVLLIPNTYAENGLILKQARELGLSTVFLLGDASHAPRLIEVAGKEAAEGLYLSTLYAPDDPDPKAKAFAEKYRNAYHEDPNSNAAFSYEAMIVLAKAIQQAGKAEPQAIRDALEKISGVDVPTGTFTMDPSTHAPLDKPVVIITVKDGKFYFVDKVVPR
ncbi:MAG: ABC transporter substrate-binding protein [Bacillota bacterium]